MGANDPTTQKYASIRFSVGDEVLIATPEPSLIDTPLTKEQVVHLLNESGYGAHSLDDETLTRLITLSEQNATKPVTIEPHTNASVAIDVNEDKLQATLHYTPAFCGEAVTQEELYDALIEMGLPDSNIDHDTLARIAHSQEPLSETIAEGMAAINGEDCHFEILFHGDTEKKPEETYAGNVDHYETHDYVTVPKGTALMRRHPATNGTPGLTIFDEVIQPEPGKDDKFELNKTVELSPDDPNLLIAFKSGHPIASNKSVFIDETLTLDEASLETGNVHFDGSVLIKGEVKPNVVIEASGDIHVKGLVESARLISGSNITIDSGVVSSLLYEDDDQDDYEHSCIIKAENDIHIRYCNSIVAEAGGSIYIENYSMHSFLKANVDVMAGVNNGKGVLLGGEIHAQENIQANVIGSEGYVKTDLFCASNHDIKKELQRSKHRLVRIEKELDMMNNVLEQIKSSGTPSTVGDLVLQKAKRIYREINELERERITLKEQLNTVKQQMDSDQSHRITVLKKIYPNIHITMGTALTRTAHTHSQCAIRVINGEIEFRDPD